MLSVPSQPIFSASSALSHVGGDPGVMPAQTSPDGGGSFESFLVVQLSAGGAAFSNSRKDRDSNAGRENTGHSQGTGQRGPTAAPAIGGEGGLWLVPATVAPENSATAQDSAADGMEPLLCALEQIQEQLRAEADQPGRFQLRLDLAPPQLGRVQLHLTLAARQLHVLVRVRNEEVRQHLEERLAELRARLANLGLDLTELEIANDDEEGGELAEPSAETAKAATGGSPRLRKRFAPLTKLVSLVDVIV